MLIILINRCGVVEEWIAAAEALARLGIRQQTLYAYVSRGRIEARADSADPRRSLYRASDIAGLANRKARGRRPADVARQTIAWGEPVLPSAITTVVRGRLYYRGQDAAALARTASLEETARLLCGVEAAPLGGVIETAIPAGTTARARAFAALAERAGRDPPARGRSRAALLEEAAGILRAVADAMAGTAHRGLLHQRLARAWGCDREGEDLIRRALVLLADHELNASTFAARVTASTGASLSAAVLAGLSALSGPLHGGSFARVQGFFADVRSRGAGAAVTGRLEQGLAFDGFGHPLYPEGDIRARTLMEAFTPAEDLVAAGREVEAMTGEAANIDFAVTALADALGLPDEAPFILFAVGRCAGWIAHALEQLQTGSLIRPRAFYTGPEPAAS